MGTAVNSAENQAASEVRAFDLAAKSGRRVEILERREENTEVFANPNGTTTRRQYAAPVWTRYEQEWKRTDPTLVRRADGTVGPAAPVFGIAFSGGGTAPLATMTKDGKQLSLSWPTTLPAPVLDGSTALYKSVLPDVDLKVITEADGFAQHLIINTPQAAANPAVKSIKLGIVAKGVTLADDAGDNLLAKDASGNVVFSAPRPKMWEQPATGPDGMAKTTTKQSAPRADATDAANGVQSAPVAADVSGNTLTLTPDPTLLATADQFPLVVDPPFTGGYREKWAVVYSTYPGEAYPNGSGWHSGTPSDEPRVGFNGEGRTRSFFAMNTNGLEGADILDATFSVEETHSWGCDASAAGPTELWSANSLSDSITWNNSGGLWADMLVSDAFAHGNPAYCPGVQGHDFHNTALKNYVKKAADNHWGTLAFGLRADSGYEGSVNSFKRFKNDPVLEVTYNFKPEITGSGAWEGGWSPGADGNKNVPCGATIGNNGLTMTARVKDQDGGKVTALFSVMKNGQPVSFGRNASSDTVASGQIAQVTMPAKQLTSGSYSWRVGAKDDENTTSPLEPACSFNVDRQGPEDPVKVTTADGKAADDPSVIVTARTRVRLTLSNTANDLAGFCWSTRPLSTSNTRCSVGHWVPVGSDPHRVTIEATPTDFPRSAFYAVAYDRAGNHSPVDTGFEVTSLHTAAPERIYGPGKDPSQGLAGQDLPGDLNGDGYPDLLATDSDGKLRFYAGDGTGNVAASEVAGQSGWGGALIAHRGDFAGFTSKTDAPDGYEDFLVRLGDGNLYLYPGDGLGGPDYWTRRELAGHPTADKVYSDWSGTRQIILPGDIDQNTAAGHARGNDMITIECTDNPCTNANLWLYSGNTVGSGSNTSADQTEPFDMNNRRLIGSGGWRDFTNLAVGDINRDGIQDLVARDPSTGQLYVYPGKMTGGVFSLSGKDERTVYGTAGWSAQLRPHLASPGNVQGTVVNATVSDPDAGTNIAYRQFQPKSGDEYGDIWATTPADPNYTVNYVDGSGTSRSTTCPTGCLLFYPGGPTSHRSPTLVGTAGWASVITNIY
ncbi:FG-GAP repeat domain-containing protein [Streptomyces sp. NPDC059991]|uniref:FG-GAP repeat domain-containing protein n=1 Tax=Streptomyces sp. NPDC059991 TaxID=3347028 RepID=UPI0036A68DBA